MSRPIDADELLAHVWRDRLDSRERIADLVKSMPTIRPERKRGQWIWHPEQKNIYGGKCVECSACGEKYLVQYIEDEKFCRNCGADMRGGKNETD